jgi:hypothetical protein
MGGKVRDCVFYAEVMENKFIIYLFNALSLIMFRKKIKKFISWVVGTGADPGFNATTTHQQNPNYRPFRQHLRSR